MRAVFGDPKQPYTGTSMETLQALLQVNGEPPEVWFIVGCIMLLYLKSR